MSINCGPIVSTCRSMGEISEKPKTLSNSFLDLKKNRFRVDVNREPDRAQIY